MKILFPVVRFTDVSSILVPFVKNMAKVLRAEVHVLRVEPALDQFVGLRVKEGTEWLEDFVATYLPDISVHKAKVIPGDPAVEILKYIDENAIDYVVIGTHGRRGLGSILFGSVAKEVVGKSPIPVLSINPYKLTESCKERSAECFEKIIRETYFKEQ